MYNIITISMVQQITSKYKHLYIKVVVLILYVVNKLTTAAYTRISISLNNSAFQLINVKVFISDYAPEIAE